MNHLGGETFVTRKITRGLAESMLTRRVPVLGNLDALRDSNTRLCGDAMADATAGPEDFVIATGRQESVRRFIEISARELGWGQLRWQGEGIEEVGHRSDTGAAVVRIDPRYYRPAEVDSLLGDPSRAHQKLGWSPITTLEELVKEMIDHDLEEARKEAYLRGEGFEIVGPRE